MHSQQPPGVVQNRSTLQCSKQNTEQCGYDHAPVTRGRMRAQFPLPHGPRSATPGYGSAATTRGSTSARGIKCVVANTHGVFHARSERRLKQLAQGS